MPQCYRHLQYDERCQIRALHQEGVSISEIARQLGRHKSTVSRELRRNAGKAGYRHKQAQRKSEQRRRLFFPDSLCIRCRPKRDCSERSSPSTVYTFRALSCDVCLSFYCLVSLI